MLCDNNCDTYNTCNDYDNAIEDYWNSKHARYIAVM